jgi:hypothetical protein
MSNTISKMIVAAAVAATVSVQADARTHSKSIIVESPSDLPEMAQRNTFAFSVHITEHPAKAKARGTALAKSEFDKSTLPNKDLRGKLTAILTCHCSFYALHDSRDWASIILKLLGAVMDLYFRSSADVLVVGALVGVLEASPAAYVINENGPEIGVPCLYIVD